MQAGRSSKSWRNGKFTGTPWHLDNRQNYQKLINETLGPFCDILCVFCGLLIFLGCFEEVAFRFSTDVGPAGGVAEVQPMLALTDLGGILCYGVSEGRTGCH